METKQKLVLIDGNSLFYKAFYAAFYANGGNRLSPEERVNFHDARNNGVRTFANMIINIARNTEHLLIAFDHKNTSTYRHQYDFYKAGRSAAPPDLYRQLDLSKEFLENFGVQWYEDSDHEADDIIGIVAKQNNEVFDVEIITTDKDLLQLVDESITVMISRTGVSDMDEFNVENFSNKFLGLTPDQVKDLKGIMGDSSDNLKGIHGIGEKGALTLLEKYGTLEKVLEEYQDNESPAMVRKIDDGKEHGLLCKKLATIKVEGKIELNIEEDSYIKQYNVGQLRNWLTENSLHNIKDKV